MEKCLICDKEIETGKFLSNHLWNVHKVKSLDYYLNNLQKQQDCCVYCGNNAKFDSLLKGFKNICSDKKCEKLLRSESTVKSKEKLRMDKEKYSIFRERTSKSVEQVWKNRVENESDIELRNKIGNSIKKNNEKLSKEELNLKYGWMNNPKITLEHKRYVWEKSLGEYHRNLNEEQKLLHYQKISNSLKSRTNEEKQQTYNKRKETILKNNLFKVIYSDDVFLYIDFDSGLNERLETFFGISHGN